MFVTPHLSVVDHFLCGRGARIGLTARGFIRDLDYGLLNLLKGLSPRAQAALNGANPAALKTRDRDIFLDWVTHSIPATDPDGRPMSIARRTELAEFCYDNRSAFLAACPAMAVEDALTSNRARNRARRPTDSDGPDGQHTVVALAYCDIFFTGDRHQGNSAGIVCRMLADLHLADVCVCPHQLAEMLQNPSR